MGSLGDELAQLVRDYIESPFSSIDNPEKKSSSQSSTYLSLQEVLCKISEEEIEIQEKITAYSKRMRFESDDERKKSMKKMVAKLRFDGYEASLCKTSWVSFFDKREGRQVFRFTENYEYIDVVNGNIPKERIIIDLDFKSQFQLAESTKAYKELIELLPSVFVGSDEKLNKVISLVCSASKRSMKEKGLYRPPWRKFRYMQAKWLSSNCKKVCVSAKSLDHV